MKKQSVVCYSNETGKNLLSLCSGKVNGASVISCHPFWYRRCKAERRCRRLFSDGGQILLEHTLAELLKKPPSQIRRMKYEARDKWIEHFEEKYFKKCRAIKVYVEEK